MTLLILNIGGVLICIAGFAMVFYDFYYKKSPILLTVPYMVSFAILALLLTFETFISFGAITQS